MNLIASIARPFLLATLLTAAPLLSVGNYSASAIAAEKAHPAIKITGHGSVSVAPDMASVTLGVVREAKTARKALTANNIAMNQVIASMKDGGIDSKDLQTTNFSMQPRYIQRPAKEGEVQKPPTIAGYTVSNTLTVRIRDLENVGQIIDRAVAMGVNMGGNIAFGNDDPKAAISSARTAAMKDAMERAETLLAAAGAKLGPVIEISENYQQPRPVPMARGRMMAESMASDQLSVEGGENTYDVTVSVSWEIIQ